MKPEEILLLNQTAENLNRLTKRFNDFLDVYLRTNFIDKTRFSKPVYFDDNVYFSNKKLGLFGVTPVIRPTALTTQLTDVTYTAPSTPDYAIQDLTQTLPYGFVTKDEGNTVLSVVKNLQTRVSELETKLQSLGLLT